ncbi:MAG: ABC transporter permease, partial [Spirochaetales bacterium]|nr:ABC transporter permease [Spirochaetales bacterium]
MSTVAEKAQLSKKERSQKTQQILQKYGIVFVLFIMIIGISILEPAFLSRSNLFNVLTQTSIFGIMALGLTFVIISKGIDLSVGSVLALSGVIAASLAQTADATGKFFPNLPVMPVIVPILAALAVGALCGGISGALIAKTNIPAFIATLGMMTVARGMALIYSDGKPVSTLTDSLTVLGGKLFGWLPIPVLIYFLMIGVSYVLLDMTRFGKSVYAIGGNIKAAEVSGVNVGRNLIAIYAYSGLLAGLAAIVFAGRVGSVHP